MLFLIAIAVVMYALAADRPRLRPQPGLAIAGADHHRPGDAGARRRRGLRASCRRPRRAIFCAAMIVGRMEVLVIIALFNPVYWRQ